MAMAQAGGLAKIGFRLIRGLEPENDPIKKRRLTGIVRSVHCIAKSTPSLSTSTASPT
jgi:hypothetical protein